MSQLAPCGEYLELRGRPDGDLRSRLRFDLNWGRGGDQFPVLPLHSDSDTFTGSAAIPMPRLHQQTRQFKFLWGQTGPTQPFEKTLP